MSLTMTVTEREAFLAEPRIAVLSVAEDGGGTVASPVWYLYEPAGPIRLHLTEPSRKLTALRRAGRATLTVQDDPAVPAGVAPMRYVSVTGTLEEDLEYDIELHGAEVWESIVRYLGPDAGARYVELGGDAYLVEEEADVSVRIIRLRPERWFTRDYGKVADRWARIIGG